MFLLVLTATSACGGGDDGGTTEATDTPTAVEDTTESETSSSSTPPTTERATTTTVAVIESPLAAIGVVPIEWTGPSESAGDRPTLAWTAAPGAVEYRVVVTDEASGRPIWAWQGTDISVPLGAGLIDGQEGPRLTAAAFVDVFALGSDGTIVAASGPQPISP